MALANFDLEELRQRVIEAYKSDDSTFRKFREYARRLKVSVKPLRCYSVNAVSFVSADGGDNRLAFNPAIVELIRVVDSRGNECALDAIAGNSTLMELDRRGRPGSPVTVDPLSRLCSDLERKVQDLSYLFKGLQQPGKSTGAIRCYRDIVEWSVLYDLITDPGLQWGGDTILIRDGLLRTKSFKRELFPVIDSKIREGVEKHRQRNVNLSVVGVAKHSAVVGRLAIALELEGTFHRPYPCYVQVDRDIEEDCYNYDRTWLETYESVEEDETGRRLYQSMGKMHLVKFGDQPFDPVWPVDIAAWQIQDAPKILGQLTVDAQQGFPIPDYPMSIQKAHDFAKLTGIEIEILQDILVQGISRNLTAEESERLLRMKHLGKSLLPLRYKEA